MKSVDEFRLVLGKSRRGPKKLPRKKRYLRRRAAAKPTVRADVVARALKSTPGAWDVIEQVPSLLQWKSWIPTATFAVCQKTGTAAFLDIWDADHFDGFTDMHRNLAECRVWFSADGFDFWDSPQTKTGRVNCYFRAPADGDYLCNVQLQSYGGPAQVECLIDSFSFGPLPFNGSINQPHPCSLNAGYHSFRIRQLSGSFFFIGLSVWRV